MFYSESYPSKKEEIVTFLGDKTNSSKKRLVICTNALGMGIDVADCCSVILFGMPDNIVDLVQEIAMILFNSYHLRRLNKDMKEILCSSNCRIFKYYEAFFDGFGFKRTRKRHRGKYWL